MINRIVPRSRASRSTCAAANAPRPASVSPSASSNGTICSRKPMTASAISAWYSPRLLPKWWNTVALLTPAAAAMSAIEVPA